MAAPQYLFWANILILVPIGLGTLLRPSVTDQGAFTESAGWRTLVGSLWLAILAGSVLGAVWPGSFLWLLAFQVIYKSIWLVTYALPRLRAGRAREIPAGIAGSFAVIVLVWPWLIPWRQMVATLSP
ncbi:MAG: hypothetical protein B9S29_01425 [Opitutia bacterium Tous-C2FEB]|jgi:hypothetical protein|nr:MAG: hypothetical protein B9S29_01425 [Opitutae bacterium Tous-C2FEB]